MTLFQVSETKSGANSPAALCAPPTMSGFGGLPSLFWGILYWYTGIPVLNWWAALDSSFTSSRSRVRHVSKWQGGGGGGKQNHPHSFQLTLTHKFRAGNSGELKPW